MFFCVEITRIIPIYINEKQCLSVDVSFYALLINYHCDDALVSCAHVRDSF